MRFPDLTPSASEMNENRDRAARLGTALEQAIGDSMRVNVKITCRGSTAKGTALPSRLFGLDYDMSICGEDELIDQIAIRSNLFEGCHILRLELALALSGSFDDIYFAGHRISGTFEGSPFDLSIVDVKKDRWKIDFNSSPILDFSTEQLSELRKVKYLMKRMNTYGSQICGVVGPACELAISHLGSLNKILRTLQCLDPISWAPPFCMVSFPDVYKRLFPEPNDYVVKGLIDSFRFTIPNTFNRLIRVASEPTLDTKIYIDNHPAQFSYRVPVPGDARFVIFMLNELLQPQYLRDIELMDEGGLVLYATESNARVIEEIAYTISKIPTRGTIRGDMLPDNTRKWLDDRRIVTFRGLPETPLSDARLYVPFDIVARKDREGLVKLIKKELHETY